MSETLSGQLEELRQLYEDGQLTEATYNMTVAALMASHTPGVSLSGGGAVATRGGVAADRQSVAIGGDFKGNIYTGPKSDDPDKALAIYRRVFAASCRQLPLRGVDVGASDPQGEQEQLNLDHVYVSLNTTARVEPDEEGRGERRQVPMEREETRPLGALEAAHANRRLVLTGDPGSGKSTFVNHLGLCLAMHGLESQAGWLDKLEPWPAAEGNMLPVTVVLRDFARFAAGEDERGEPIHLWSFIRSLLKRQNLDFVAAHLHDRLEAGEVYLLLDGLDEIAQQSQRTAVRDAVMAFAERYDRCRILVTCRTLSYQDPAWQLTDFPAHELAPFDDEQIGRFVEAWYGELQHLGAVTAEELAHMVQRLQEATQRPDLRRLASNPLLLTVMALVHTHKGRLPDARALLYEETVEILLWRWEQIKAGREEEQPRLRRLLLDAGRADVDLKKVLWRLAFDAHGEGGTDDDETLADIGELQLVKALATLHPEGNWGWAQRITGVIKLRAGLLVERTPGVYTFPHRTFQEYLAGAFLSNQADFARRAAGLVADGAFWRQVILLAVGRLVYFNGDTDKPLALVGELCPATATDDEDGWRRAWLAGEVLVEITPNRVRDSTLGSDLLHRVRQRLVDLLQTGALMPVERAQAGDALAALGDPRFRVDAWFLPDEPLLGFVEIPAGAFFMGSDPKRDPDAMNRESPQHQFNLPSFYMARYPVTVAQFRRFCDVSGHKPTDPNSLRDPANRPVRWISWYEALKYCDWLTETLRDWEGTPEPLATLLHQGGDERGPWRITLPSEAEWEKAARGDDGRIYPWGDRLTADHANHAETQIGMTNAVGTFPAGASPYGLLDMSGNLWEWTRSLWGTDWQKPQYGYPYDSYDGREEVGASADVLRVLRGGSFSSNENFLRCAARRRWLGPIGWYRNFGFRLCAAPIHPGR